MPTALLSVSDKTGLPEFASALVDEGWEIVSTGGTAGVLRDAEIAVTEVSDFTGFPEILGGRVKTLHPAVHAGLLARRSVPSDMEHLRSHDLDPVDLVAVNLYPFRETVARPTVTLAEALDQIDIGGPTLLRAAAKNHAFVWAVCDPADYGRVLEALDDAGSGAEIRRSLASKVFFHTAAYDAAIAGYLRPGGRERSSGPPVPEEMLWSLHRVRSLRYGENPDQTAAFYREAAGATWGIPSLRQRHGKELSYNNLLDLDGALAAIAPFRETQESACVIIKHTSPCGIAQGRSVRHAYRKALASDPLSAFGSTVAFSHPVTEAVAEELSELFVECLLAPGYASAALRILQRKKNLRILEPRENERLGALRGHVREGLEIRGVQGGMLIQSSPDPAVPGRLREASRTRVPTSRQPDDDEWEQLAFAWAAVQGVKSNAILLARDRGSIGIGAGQMSRVDAVRLAIRKAEDVESDVEGSVLASDAFFPFRDGIDTAAAAGVRAIIQPGGSIRDEEVVEAADEHDVAMVFTGRRVFRH